jgi:hypothetical protein
MVEERIKRAIESKLKEVCGLSDHIEQAIGPGRSTPDLFAAQQDLYQLGLKLKELELLIKYNI